MENHKPFSSFFRYIYFIAPLGLASCVATREDVASLEVQIARLEQSVNVLQKKQAELSPQLDAIKTPVMSLNSNLSDTQDLLTNFNPRFEEIQTSLENLKKDLSLKAAQITARLAEIDGRIQEKLSEIRKMQTASAKNRAPVKTSKEPPKKTKNNGAEEDISSASNGDASANSPLAVFQAAYKDFSAQRWELAQSGFASYLNQEPQGSLADKSHYYSALAYKATNNSNKAMEQLETVLNHFSKSPLARAAMLEKSKIFMEENRLTEAEGMLEYLAVTYPKSQEATEARNLLKKLPAK